MRVTEETLRAIGFERQSHGGWSLAGAFSVWRLGGGWVLHPYPFGVRDSHGVALVKDIFLHLLRDKYKDGQESKAKEIRKTLGL